MLIWQPSDSFIQFVDMFFHLVYCVLQLALLTVTLSIKSIDNKKTLNI